MIKFFRKIRQNLLMENKTGKYFKYAIGEIILVVIGLLIALQINNWNEEKKLERQAITYIKKVSDFIYNSASNTYELEMIKTKYYILNSFINKDSNIYSVFLNPNPIRFSFNSEFDWDNSFDIVLENQKIYPDKFDKIIGLLRQMNSVREGYINSSANTLAKMSEKNKYIMSSNFEWYPHTDKESNAKRKAYYFTDFQFYNRLYDFKNEYSAFAGQYTRLRALQIELWIELKLMNAFEDKTTLQEGLQRFEMKELQLLDCKSKDETEKSIQDFLIWSVLINKSRDTLFYTTSDVIKNVGYRWIDNVLPGETKIISSGRNNYIQILENKECTKLLKTEINGYWIYESMVE